MATDSANQQPPDRRLNSWKEIAAYFGKDERTVKRWEGQRGLPVHRLPGGARKTVFAYASEFEAWLKGGTEPETAPAGVILPDNAMRRRPTGRGRVLFAAGLIGAGLIASALTVELIGARQADPAPGIASAGLPPHQPSAEARDLYLTGVYHWESRTPEGLRRSVDLFDQAIAKDPDYADAYVGLANAYNLLSQYTVMRPEIAYPLAGDAARKALQLDGQSAGAYSALAFTTFYWLHDIDRAKELFSKALALDPTSSQTWHWYALALMHTGQMDEPVKAIEKAQLLDPVSRSILANKALIYFYAGRVDEAVALLKDLTASAPEFQPPHFYLATIYLDRGQFSDYFDESRLAAKLSGNDALADVIAAGAGGYAAGGANEMFARMLAVQQAQNENGRETAFNLARTAAQAGLTDAAFAYLDESVRSREPDALGIRIDPSLKPLRADPRFEKLAKTAFAPPAEHDAGAP